MRGLRDLVQVLKARGSVDRFQLLEALGIDLMEKDLIKAIDGQLETLVGFGMVKAENNNIQWVA
jgi:oligoendopeptidase F